MFWILLLEGCISASGRNYFFFLIKVMNKIVHLQSKWQECHRNFLLSRIFLFSLPEVCDRNCTCCSIQRATISKPSLCLGVTAGFELQFWLKSLVGRQKMLEDIEWIVSWRLTQFLASWTWQDETYSRFRVRVVKQIKLSLIGHNEQRMHQTCFQKVKVEFI